MDIPYTSLQSNDGFGLTMSNLKYSAILGAATDTTLTVPNSAKRYKVLLKAETGTTVWFAADETAAVPVGGTFAAVSSELLPAGGELCREFAADVVLHFISTAANADVSVVFYAI